ncbi:5-oxoprolinase subunit PxpA [Algoriphagus zhangzhouensis]|uniref:UPF0271 protein n=1 Tax=Algoriphagus zhangzhouensis TaxID=1073327 RepID=A0A1M7Z3U3_9BACT|nr:5-oxoprolinase subunit PxpA [Algoriphagus zhangzhouensis]TDY48493.1 UPF0271 protein [Algoriphagus zhangzhouensis]SHO59541.1 UPF0271 protein [Algoriphagus zhangzhouensis]
MLENRIKINCDLGEGVEWEDQIIPYIDAASVACGGHYGNAASIRKTLISCQDSNKKVGAHPSYPDVENFGRISMDIPVEKLLESIEQQIALFESIRKELGMEMDHIKFHGALYNDAAKNPNLAKALVDFIASAYPNTCLFVPPQSETEKAAKEKGLKIRREIFGDRAYGNDLKLRPRSEENSLYHTFEQVNGQLEAVFEHRSIRAVNGQLIPIMAETICFHGDNPAALTVLPQIRKKWWS